MPKVLHTLLCLLALQTHTTYSQWEFTVTTKTKIIFYDEHWSEVTSSAHQFDQLSAITFDETEEIIYFNDQLHNNGSIFSLKIPTSLHDPHIIEKIVQRTPNEWITSIAYDPLNRNIFWSDQKQKKILFRSVDSESETEPQLLVDMSGEESMPDGIAIDVCRRKLYWTNSNLKNATVERIDLDGRGRELIVQSGLYLPHGIVVDQFSDRIFWVVDQQGTHYSVESANLDGSDREVIVRGLDKVPLSLAVTKDAMYWTDSTHNAVFLHSKFNTSNKFSSTNETTATESLTKGIDFEEEPMAGLKLYRIKRFVEQLRGIAARTGFLTKLAKDEHCASVIRKIKSRLLTPKPTKDPVNAQIEKLKRSFCVNGGEYSEHSGVCICQIGYSGARCEISDCHNYCVHGTCTLSSLGFAECSCQKGFYGKRCQSYKCSEYCMNNGHCKIDSSGEPMCECRDNFGGQRCEQNLTEVCALFCRILKHEPEAYVPFGCQDICEDLSVLGEDGEESYAIPKYQHLEVCKNTITWHSTGLIVLVSGVVLSLCLVLLIVHALRRFYKPARPRIKKTFVVRKQAHISSSDTPLTNRPMATEQCEITIENCCNMNICDTPCFDPKLVQQSLSRNASTKEDKKMLIHSMEDELY